MTERFALFDAADYLTTPERVAAYLEAVLEENDAASLSQALGTIARAKGMAQIAERSGRSREQLYRTLSEKGNPQLDTLMSVLEAMGLRLSIQPIEPEPQAA